MDYLMFLLGVFIGSLLAHIIYFRYTASGTLVVDRTNPEKDTYKLEIDNLDDLSKKKRVLLKVKKILISTPSQK